MKLEVGARRRMGPDWQVLDIVPGPEVDIVADLSRPLDMIADGTCELVYASHVLEHVPWFCTVDVLRELRRILAPGGRCEVWVPDLDVILELYRQGRTDGWHKHNPDADPFIWLNGRIFTYGPGPENFHRAVFNEPHLVRCFEQAGFVEVGRLSRPRGADHGVINLGIGGTRGRDNARGSGEAREAAEGRDAGGTR